MQSLVDGLEHGYLKSIKLISEHAPSIAFNKSTVKKSSNLFNSNENFNYN